jgi:hypothetical protein
MEGATKEGVGGFFKGVGKGLVGYDINFFFFSKAGCLIFSTIGL